MPFDLDLSFGGKRYKDAQRGLMVLGEQLGKAADDFSPAIKKQLRDLMDTIIAAMRQRHSTPWAAGVTLPTGNRTGKLAKRSGRFMRTLKGEVHGTGDAVRGELYGDPLLVVHEEGRTITPKKKQYLAIPLPAALDSRGVPKKRSPRDWKRTFVAKSRKGNLIIFRKVSKSKILPLYLLTKKSVIPERLGLVITGQTALPVFEDRLFDKLVRELMKGI